MLSFEAEGEFLNNRAKRCTFVKKGQKVQQKSKIEEKHRRCRYCKKFNADHTPGVCPLF